MTEEFRIFCKGWKVGRNSRDDANKYYKIHGDEILKETPSAIFIQIFDRHEFLGKVTSKSDDNYQWLPKSLCKILTVEEWDKLGMPTKLEE